MDSHAFSLDALSERRNGIWALLFTLIFIISIFKNDIFKADYILQFRMYLKATSLKISLLAEECGRYELNEI